MNATTETAPRPSEFPYHLITDLQFETDCTSISLYQWNFLMQRAKVADAQKINQLVKKFLPGLFDTLHLQFPNPYTYFRTDTHLVLVHSAIEYFLKYTLSNSKPA